MSRPICTVDVNGNRRFFMNGKRVKEQPFDEVFPTFNKDTGCLTVSQRSNLLRTLAPAIVQYRHLLENNLIADILRELAQLRESTLTDREALQGRVNEIGAHIVTIQTLTNDKSNLAESLRLCNEAKTALETRSSNAEARVAELERSVADNLANLNVANSKMGDLQKAVNGLKNSLKQCKEARRACDVGLKSCSTEVSSLANKYRDLEGTYGAEKTLWMQEKAELQSRLATLQTTMEESVKELEAVQPDLIRGRNVEVQAIDMRKAIAGLKSSLKQCKDARRTCSDENKSLANKYRDLEGEKTLWTQDKTAMQARLDALARDIEGHLVTIEQKNAKTGELQTSVDGLTKSLTLCDSAKASLERSVEEARAQVQELETTLATNVAQLTSANAQMGNLNKAVTGLKSSLKECKQVRAYLKDRADMFERINTTDKELLDNYKIDIVPRLQADAAKQREANARSIKKIEDMVKELAKAKTTEDRLAELQRQSDAYLAELNTLRSSSSQHKDAYQASIDEIRELKAEAAKKEEQVREENRDLHKKIDDAERKLAEAGDICFVSEDGARECLQKIREKYPNVVAVVPQQGIMIESGEILPSLLPQELERAETVPIETDEGILPIIPVQPSKVKKGKLSKEQAVEKSIQLKKNLEKQKECAARNLAYSEEQDRCITYEALQAECKAKGMKFDRMYGACYK
jgi:chromosome segregation ATPase